MCPGSIVVGLTILVVEVAVFNTMQGNNTMRTIVKKHMAPQRVDPSAVFDTPSRPSIVRSKLKTISEDHPFFQS